MNPSIQILYSAHVQGTIYESLLVAHLQLEERPQNDVSDEYSWWCRQCKGHKTIKEGSFSKSKLTLQKWLFLLVLWAKDTPVTDTIDDVEIDTHTAVNI